MSFHEVITLRQLNEKYGHKGRTFVDEDEARAYAALYARNVYVYRLINYHPSDFVHVWLTTERGIKYKAVERKPDAKPVTIGWLVSTPGGDSTRKQK